MAKAPLLIQYLQTKIQDFRVLYMLMACNNAWRQWSLRKRLASNCEATKIWLDSQANDMRSIYEGTRNGRLLDRWVDGWVDGWMGVERQKNRRTWIEGNDSVPNQQCPVRIESLCVRETVQLIFTEYLAMCGLHMSSPNIVRNNDMFCQCFLRLCTHTGMLLGIKIFQLIYSII